MRHYDRDRPVNQNLTPVQVAQQRSQQIEDPAQRARFMDTFRVARIAGHRGEDLYKSFRLLLDEDDSAAVAGLIEGLASTREPIGMVK